MWSYSHAATAKLQPPRTRIQWCPCTCIGRACNTHRPAQCVMARLRHTKSVQAALRPGNIRAAFVVAAAARLVAGNVAEGTAAAGCVENTAPLPTRLRDTPPVAQNSGRTSVLLCRPLCRGRHAAAVATLYNVCHIHTQKHTHTHTHTQTHTQTHTSPPTYEQQGLADAVHALHPELRSAQDCSEYGHSSATRLDKQRPASPSPSLSASPWHHLTGRTSMPAIHTMQPSR